MEKWRKITDIEHRALCGMFSNDSDTVYHCKTLEHALWVLGIIIAKDVDIEYVRLHTFEEYHDKKEFFINEGNLARHEFDAIKKFIERRY